MVCEGDPMKAYIGIDPGTACGWAILGKDGQRKASGVWDLKPRRHEGAGMRFVRVRKYFMELLDLVEPYAFSRVWGDHSCHPIGV